MINPTLVGHPIDIITIGALASIVPEAARIASSLNATWRVVSIKSKSVSIRMMGQNGVETRILEPRVTCRLEFIPRAADYFANDDRARVHSDDFEFMQEEDEHPWLLNDDELEDEDDGDDWRAITLNERTRARLRREAQEIIDGTDAIGSRVPWVDEREIIPTSRHDLGDRDYAADPYTDPEVMDLLYTGARAAEAQLATYPRTPYTDYLTDLFVWARERRFRHDDHDDWDAAMRSPGLMAYLRATEMPRLRPAPRPPQIHRDDRQPPSRVPRFFRNDVVPPQTPLEFRYLLCSKGWHKSVPAMLAHCKKKEYIKDAREEQLLTTFLQTCIDNNRRARIMLFGTFTPKQKRTARRYDYFDVTSSEGNLFRIRMWAPHQNVFLLDPKTHAPLKRFCAYLKGAPVHGCHVAQKLTLESNEAAFMAGANSEKMPDLCPINEGYGVGSLGLPLHTALEAGDWGFMQIMLRPFHEEFLMPVNEEELEKKRQALDALAPIPVTAQSPDWFGLDGDDDEYVADIEY